MKYFMLQADLVSKGTDLASRFMNSMIAYAPKVIGAIVFYIIGSWIIGRLGMVLRKTLTARNFRVHLFNHFWFLSSRLFVLCCS